MRAQRAGRRIGSFDRTYEGLKRLGAYGLTRYSATFDRTYEGLKPLITAHLLLPEPAFDRTYEGLKPGLPLLYPMAGRSF